MNCVDFCNLTAENLYGVVSNKSSVNVFTETSISFLPSFFFKTKLVLCFFAANVLF